MARELVTTIDGIDYFWNVEANIWEWRIPDIREAIEAEMGHLILSADYSQIEIKIMAFMCQDESFIDAINSGKDIHSVICTQIFGKAKDFTYELMNTARKDEKHPRFEELSSLRSKIKTVVFGVIYGAGAFNISEQTGMSEEDSQEFIDLLFSTYPKMKQWIDLQGRNAIEYGFTATIRGRKRFYYIPDSFNKEYDKIISQIRRWAGNQPIQGASADMLKLAMYLIYKKLKAAGISPEDARILFVVHDEIVMTSKLEIADQVQEIMESSMSEAYEMIIQGIKNKIDVARDKTWKKV